ncbi:MAG: alcohol dehydrogenase catalytic domain-containing protein [Armatimonadota bacterium]|nr:MAG: alcohol dehydrogenase catalytic domain-containing protein [Armatimonadota bacterium]
MKAAFKQGETVTLRDIELRPLRPDEIRLRVEACGICGTDLHVVSGEQAEAPFGHEVAGVIVELGSAVSDLAVGQQVALDSSTPCGRCANCRNARQELCTDIKSFFHLGYMGLAGEMIAPAISAIPYLGLTPEVAALSEPLGVAIDMVRLAEMHPDSNVLIMGPGPIGLMALALVKRMGARRVFVSAYSSQKARARAAHEFGADVVIDPTETPLEDYDFDCAIDRILVTTRPPTFAGAFRAAAKGGIISFIGIGHGEDALCRFDANDFHFKKLQLRASFASPALFTPLALEYLREGVVDGEALISHRFPLERIEQAMATARDKARAVKVVVMP